jgi:hypothetical protein
VWETIDPDGRRVELAFDRWRHICVQHPELEAFRTEILALVSAPETRLPGRQPAEEWLYGSGFGPTRHVKVVVHYEGDIGQVATAFPRRRFP